MSTSRSSYRIVQYVRADSHVVHPPMTYREALDEQLRLTKEAGTQRPAYMYRVEQHDEDNSFCEEPP